MQGIRPSSAGPDHHVGAANCPSAGLELHATSGDATTKWLACVSLLLHDAYTEKEHHAMS